MKNDTGLMSSGKTCLMWLIIQEEKLRKGEISEEEFDERLKQKRHNHLFIYPKC